MEDYILLSIPLYILLGEILVRSRRDRQDVRRAGAVARPPARRPAAHQCRRVGAVLGRVRLVGLDRRDHRDRGAALVPPPQIRRPPGARLDRGRRLARQPHSARHRVHRLRVADQHLGRPALRRGDRPERDDDAAVHADHRRRGAAAARPLRASANRRVPLARAHRAPRRPVRPARRVRHHHGLGLHRLGDGDRVRRAVGDRRARHRGVRTARSRSACCTMRSWRPRTSPRSPC